MTSKRYFFTLCGVFGLVILLIIGGAAGGDYLLQKQSTKLTNLKIQNKSLENQHTALAQAQKDIQKYSELNAITKSIVPQDKDQAETVQEVIAIAARNSISIKSVTFDTSTLGATVPAPAAAATTDGSAAPKVAPPISQLKPITGIPGVYTLQLQVQSAKPIKYQAILNFLSGLENNRRTAQVTTIALNPNDKDPTLLDFNITLNAYVKP